MIQHPPDRKNAVMELKEVKDIEHIQSRAQEGLHQIETQMYCTFVGVK